MEYKFSEDKDFSSKLKSFFDISYESRRSGRSFLLARIFIELGIETGEKISPNDHMEIYARHCNHRTVQSLNGEISNVIRWYATKGIDIEVQQYDRTMFTFKLKRGYEIYQHLRIPVSVSIEVKPIINNVVDKRLLLLL